MADRKGHFMPTALLDSQFATLQPLREDEAGVAVDVSGTPEEITGRAARRSPRPCAPLARRTP